MILSTQHLTRIDFRVVLIILSLMTIGLLVISSHTTESAIDATEEGFFTQTVYNQLQRCGIGLLVFFFLAGFDYNKLREWTWILYILMIIALVGVFFTDSIARVNRWYRIPFLGINIQPSEQAKLILMISLSWFLERRRSQSRSLSTAFFACLILGIPFLLILKQPDLGTALVLMPMALVMFYFGDVHPLLIRMMTWSGALLVLLVAAIFLGFLPYENIKPYAMTVLKEYQFERLNPDTHHQKAAATAIALGGITGTGWRRSAFTGGGWLPAPYTDSVFPAFAEEFGFIGVATLIGLFYALIYCCFQVCAVAKDHFGRLLSAGVTTYLAIHILINIGMMSGFLPITGVPLILVTYGGSSIFVTMAALGILQSIYSRRFMF